MVIAHSVSKTISRHFKHFIKWEHMKTDFHNLMNLKAALANIQYNLLNYVIMVHVDSMIIRSVLSDQQKPMVVGELKKIIGPKLVICDYLNKSNTCKQLIKYGISAEIVPICYLFCL